MARESAAVGRSSPTVLHACQGRTLQAQSLHFHPVLSELGVGIPSAGGRGGAGPRGTVRTVNTAGPRLNDLRRLVLFIPILQTKLLRHSKIRRAGLGLGQTGGPQSPHSQLPPTLSRLWAAQPRVLAPVCSTAEEGADTTRAVHEPSLFQVSMPPPFTPIWELTALSGSPRVAQGLGQRRLQIQELPFSACPHTSQKARTTARLEPDGQPCAFPPALLHSARPQHCHHSASACLAMGEPAAWVSLPSCAALQAAVA